MNATFQYLAKLGYAPTDFSNVIHEGGHASLPENPQSTAPAAGSGIPREASPKPGVSQTAAPSAAKQPPTNEKLSEAGARFRKNIQSMLADR